jgi:GT2 family glycosyltransferase
VQLSVCICTRNRPEELERALISVGRSSVAVAEVVVSDDSDGEESRAVAARHGARWVRGPRRGLGPNRNRAAGEVRGSHVLFLDDDAELGETFVERVQSCRDRHADPARLIVTGREDNRGRLVEPRAPDWLGFQRRPYRPGDELRTIVINAAVVPADVAREVGFDEQLVYGYDEVDFAERALAAGCRIVACPDAVNRHTPSAVNRDFYAPHVHTSRLYVVLKHRFHVRRQPVRGALVAIGATAHLILTGLRAGGLRGAADAARSAARGFGHLRRAGRR